MLLTKGFTSIPSVKVLFNVGALLDIPTGFWIKGMKGEHLLNGGVGTITGMVGIGNNFKSTILHYMLLQAMDRVYQSYPTQMLTYDTEINVHLPRLERLAKRMVSFKDREITKDDTWMVTDKTIMQGDEWFDKLKDNLNEKRKSKEYLVPTPFVSRDGTPLKILIPTFGEVDSLSEFSTSNTTKMLDEHVIGDSGANTYHMRSGLEKTRFMMEMPALGGGTYHYSGLTAQVGKEISMPSGPMPAPPVRKLVTLKHGDKIKSATDKFTFATNVCWQAYHAKPLINQTTKVAEYPISGFEAQSGDTDLMIVSLLCLRSKSGPSGYMQDIIVSQREGVLPELTEFHYLKDCDRFGFGGNRDHYFMALYPECKLMRTTVREKIDTDPKLRRALNISAEMCQMRYMMPEIRDDLMCTPEELYNDLKAKGYDWDILLNTRGWYTLKNYSHPIPFLSTMDLLLMRKGEYHPFWLKEDKKTIITFKDD